MKINAINANKNCYKMLKKRAKNAKRNATNAKKRML